MSHRKRSSGPAAPVARGNTGSLPILATKLHRPPARSNLVSRPRLMQSLTLSIENRLILLSAPAGFGKTTLLSEWLAAHPCPAGWLSLDRGDNDPVRFWTYLIAALQTIRPELGESAKALLHTSPASPLESILTLLINDLASLSSCAVLVLDDYHLIDSPAVHGALAFLLDHLPPGVHLVIATRADPPIALAHLRAQGRLLELRVDRLRFNLEETAEFLNETMRLGLPAGDIETLADRTEGWIAGLQLAAMSLKGRTDGSALIHALSSSQRYILDYLVEEVLNLQPGDIQAFLLQTCILERLCGPLCDALLADEPSLRAMEDAADSHRPAPAPIARSEGPAEQSRMPWPASGQAILEYLERANLFVVPLDHERQWYRYHHLFADLLRSRLVQSFGNAHVRALHSRAAAWYEANGLLAEAIEHALAAHETQRAARLIEDVADGAWLSGEFYQVLRWIEALPGELMRSRPWLCVWCAWSRLQAGTLHGVDELIDYAEAAARTQVEESPGLAQDEALLEQVAALRVTCAGLRQETDRTIELAASALERPPASNQAASQMARSNVLNVLGFAYYVSGELSRAEQAYGAARRVAHASGFLLRELLVVHKLAHIDQVMGHLREPYRLYRGTLAYLQEQGKGAFFAAGYLYCGLSHLLYEWNRFDEAQGMIAEGLRLNELAQVPHLTIDCCQAQARLLLAQQELDGAQTALQRAADLIRKHYCWPEVVSANEYYQVRLWLANGDMASVSRWAAEWANLADRAPAFRDEQDLLTLARAWLALGRAGQTAELLGRMQESAARGGRRRRSAEILALRAKAWQMLGQGRRAAETLEESLAVAAPMGCVRLFLDEGPELIALVTAAGRRSGLAAETQEFARCVLASSPEGRPENSARSCPPAAPALIEPLTPREQEVLALLAAGCSNRDIAGRLVITLASVKKHTGNIYGKLSVTSRTQAIARARQLGLLADEPPTLPR